MSDSVIQIRVDSKLKKNAEDVLTAMGLRTSEAIRMFLQQTINDQALPFRPHIKKMPNQATLNSFLEVDNGDYEDVNLSDFKKITKSKK